MAATPWGDPATESFRKKHIRESRVGGSLALVNTQIVAAATRLLEGLTDLHVELPQQVPSFDPAGTEAQQLGLAFRLAIPFSEETDALLTKWGFAGFATGEAADDVPEFRFVGTTKDAMDLNDTALALFINRLEAPEVSGPSPVQWPGSRDLVLDDTGLDVLFLQLLFNCPDQDGRVGESLIECIRMFEARRGAPEITGVIDAVQWKAILPAVLPTVYSGDSGFIVRVLQSALVAHEFTTTRVTGIFGVLTSKDVRAMQKDNGMRQGNFVRAPEWSILLGPGPWRS